MTIIQNPSPNFDERQKDTPIDMLILHYTGMKTGKEALMRMCDAKAEVSAHYMVEEDGRIFQLVKEDKRAWHAGVAYWRGHTNINARSIGIEIVNPGHEWGYRSFPEVQINAVITLCQAILKRHHIPPRNVIGHSDVAPARKEDPGELFPWEKLAKNNIGIWPDDTQKSYDLKNFGYKTNTEKADIMAFQRHFTPKNLTGKIDDITIKALHGLGAKLIEA